MGGIHRTGRTPQVAITLLKYVFDERGGSFHINAVKIVRVRIEHHRNEPTTLLRAIIDSIPTRRIR